MNVSIISPTIVYGLSPSVDHPLPITFAPIIKAISSIGQGFTVDEGKNLQSWIHVKDQASMYILLLQDALRSLETGVGNPDLWGKDAYFFSVDEELPFAEYMAALTKLLKSRGILQTSQLKIVDIDQVARAMGAEREGAGVWAKAMATLCAMNMRVRSTRADKAGWRCSGPKVEDTLAEVLSQYLELNG